MANFTYNPPGNQNDFKNVRSLQLWGQKVKKLYWNSIWGIRQEEDPIMTGTQDTDMKRAGIAYRLPNPEGLAQHYPIHPHEEPIKSYLQFRSTKDLHQILENTKAKFATKQIAWTSFPMRIYDQKGTIKPFEVVEKLGWPYDDPNPKHPKARQMDEYCEWFTHRDERSNKITRIDITCETPEYFAFLIQHEPDTAVELYRKYVSPQVKLEDLKRADGSYDPYNKWNTTNGIMHLNCPPNCLSAEIYIAAQASTYWQKIGSNPVTYATDGDDLIKSGQYGLATRASDPTIVASVNALIRKDMNASASEPGLIISVSDPVGLYLCSLDTSGWQKNNMRPFTPDEIKQIVTYERGGIHPLTNDKLHLRIKIEIPESWGYTLGDCFIGGVPIDWAGQIIYASAKTFLIGAALAGHEYIFNDADTKAIVPPKKDWNGVDIGPKTRKEPLYPPPD